jgi:hypothetical protein
MKKVGTYKLEPCEVDYYKIHSDLSKDGRHVGRVAESWWARVSGGVRQPENSPFDVLEKDNTKTEVRSAIKSVSFAPSKETGYGRKVTEDGFKGKLNGLDRFIIVKSENILTDGDVDFWELSKKDVLSLGLGKNKNMSAKKFWKKVESQF